LARREVDVSKCSRVVGHGVTHIAELRGGVLDVGFERAKAKPALNPFVITLGLLLIAAATACGSQQTEPLSHKAHGTVAVRDRRGDTDTPQIDIVRARLALRRGLFVGTITTVKPIKGSIESVSAIVSIDAGGQDWWVTGDWEPTVDFGALTSAETTCEAIEGVDFDHPRPCKARFDKRGATIRFRASLLRNDDALDVQFETEKPHETDVVPDDRDDKAVTVRLKVIE